MRIKLIPYTCVVCNKSGQGRLGRRYCSNECRDKWNNRRSQYNGLATATVGAIQELRVAADLLKKGYEVFRALSPSCSCDLLIKKNNRSVGVEVRTAYQRKDGHLYYTKSKIRAEYLALALPDNIIYKPKL